MTTQTAQRQRSAEEIIADLARLRDEHAQSHALKDTTNERRIVR